MSEIYGYFILTRSLRLSVRKNCNGANTDKSEIYSTVIKHGCTYFPICFQTFTMRNGRTRRLGLDCFIWCPLANSGAFLLSEQDSLS